MTRAKFEDISIQENHEPLVDLRDYPFVVQAMYFEQGLSDTPAMMTRRGIAEKLLEIQATFDGKYKFKIWDSYRPRKVQDAIYNGYWSKLAAEHPEWDEEQLHFAVQKFVTKASESKRIPPHATGGAIDLTLVDKDDQELNMGTEFDFFGPEAAALYYEDNDEAIQGNRRILRESMVEHGFAPDEDEWWHFDYGDQLWAIRSDQAVAIYGEVNES